MKRFERRKLSQLRHGGLGGGWSGRIFSDAEFAEPIRIGLCFRWKFIHRQKAHTNSPRWFYFIRVWWWNCFIFCVIPWRKSYFIEVCESVGKWKKKSIRKLSQLILQIAGILLLTREFKESNVRVTTVWDKFWVEPGKRRFRGMVYLSKVGECLKLFGKICQAFVELLLTKDWILRWKQMEQNMKN